MGTLFRYAVVCDGLKIIHNISRVVNIARAQPHFSAKERGKKRGDAQREKQNKNKKTKQKQKNK